MNYSSKRKQQDRLRSKFFPYDSIALRLYERLFYGAKWDESRQWGEIRLFHPNWMYRRLEEAEEYQHEAMRQNMYKMLF